MLCWLRTFVITGSWTFALVGLIGAAEVTWRWARHGLGDAGFLETLLPAVTFYGWFGLAVAVLVGVPLAVFLRRRPDVAPTIRRQALAAGISVTLVAGAGYVLSETALGLWWQENLSLVWPPLVLAALGLTLVVVRPLRRADRLLARESWPIAVPLLLLVVVLSLLWPDHREAGRHRNLDPDGLGTAPAGAPNLVLLCIDTLRRDKLSCVDPSAPATPHLDGLAAAGRLYTNAWATSSWTLPSMATVMTGLPPRSLNLGKQLGLPPSVTTLAECAWRAGWWTSAVVANPYLGEEFGFRRGFADFEHSDVLEPLDPVRHTVLARAITRYVIAQTDFTDGRLMVDLAARWLEGYDRDQPFLLWVHLMDTHMPYRRHPDPSGALPTLPDHPLLERDRFDDMAGLREALPDVPAEVRRAVADLYDGEVRYADACVGDLWSALEATGHADRTWVVVFSDHGEEFFEHGGFEHGHSLLPEVSSVPLVIRPPGGLPVGVRDDRAVSLLDLVPSLCQALGWSSSGALPGRASLIPRHDADLAAPTGLTVLENMLYGPPQQAALRWPDFRVVELPTGRTDWFDLAGDPGAQAPVTAPDDAAMVSDHVRQLLAGWDAAADSLGAVGRQEAELSDSAKRRLRSLGY